MNLSSHLYELVKQLSPHEKGYVQKLALAHSRNAGQNKYSLLLDAVDAQEEYDEALLIKNLGYSDNPNNFASVKKYLYDFILRSLEDYHEIPKNEVRRMLNQVEILFQKNLQDQCTKLLEKAEKLALKYQFYDLLLEICDWQQYLQIDLDPTEKNEEKVEENRTRFFELLNNFAEEFELRCDFSVFMMRWRRKGYARNENEFTNEINAKRLEKYPELKTFFGNYFALYLRLQISMDQYNYPEALAVIQKINALWDKHPNMKEIKQKSYASSMFYFSVVQMANFDITGMNKSLEKVDALIAQNYLVKEKLNFSVLFFKFDASIYMGETEKAIGLYKQIQQEFLLLSEKEKNSSLAFDYYLRLAIWELITGNIKEAIQSINASIDVTGASYRSDVYCFAQIVSLIVYFESGKEDLLVYKTKSVYRFLLKRKRLYQLENLVLSFIRNTIFKINSKKEEKAAFIKMKEKLTEVLKDPFEKKALFIFDLSTWLDSKIQQKNFMEVKRLSFEEELKGGVRK